MDWLYYLGIIILSGVLLGALVGLLKLPKVTGYLIAGILIGPFCLKLIPKEAISSLNIISEAALGFIAYSIGSSININKLKKFGAKIIIITCFEALTAAVVVTFVMSVIFKQPLAFSLCIGAIATATAPAATIMVLKQYKAKGPLVDTLIPVVAIDDAVAVISFGIAVAVAKVLDGGSSAFNMMTILKPFIEIGGAVLLGAVIGVILIYADRFSKGREQTLVLTVGVILLSVGIATKLNVSSLLTCMSIGAVVSNLTQGEGKLLTVLDEFTNPIFVAFFTISGAGLDLGILKSVGLLGIVYVLSRSFGKIIGAYLGCKLSKIEPVVQKYLGLTLMPQAGVAIGLSLLVEQALPAYGTEIRTIILAGTVIYELIGPLCTKIAIFKAGEAQVS